jgi:phosphate uptake regulator
MEQRKIMSLGRSSLVIALPKEWIRLNELKKGNVVSLDVKYDRSLSVFPSLEKKWEEQSTTLTIDPDEKDRIIARKIIACYLNGYSGIRLVSAGMFSASQQSAIRDIARTLYMRITESDAKQVYVETLAEESKLQIESSISRMHIISSSMCQDIFTALKNRDISMAKTVVTLDDDVDHFSFFLLRLLRNAAVDSNLANQLAIDPVDCLDYQTLVNRIEEVADKAVYIANNLIMLEGRQEMISKTVLERIYTAGVNTLTTYDKAVNGLLAKDITNCDEIIEFQTEKIEEFDREIVSLPFTEEKDALILCALDRIRDSIKRIAGCAAEIAEITIDQSYKLSRAQKEYRM